MVPPPAKKMLMTFSVQENDYPFEIFRYYPLLHKFGDFFTETLKNYVLKHPKNKMSSLFSVILIYTYNSLNNSISCTKSVLPKYLMNIFLKKRFVKRFTFANTYK